MKEVYKGDFHFTGTNNKKITLTRKEWEISNHAETLMSVNT